MQKLLSWKGCLPTRKQLNLALKFYYSDPHSFKLTFLLNWGKSSKLYCIANLEFSNKEHGVWREMWSGGEAESSETQRTGEGRQGRGGLESWEAEGRAKEVKEPRWTTGGSPLLQSCPLLINMAESKTSLPLCPHKYFSRVRNNKEERE